MLNIATVISLIKQYGGADPAVIEAKVEEWLDAHPEATTTVQDGSITEQKLATSIAQKLGLISSLSDEIDTLDGDVTDLKSALNNIPISVYNVFTNYDAVYRGKNWLSGTGISMSDNSGFDIYRTVINDTTKYYLVRPSSGTPYSNFVRFADASNTYLGTASGLSALNTPPTGAHYMYFKVPAGEMPIAITEDDLSNYNAGYKYTLSDDVYIADLNAMGKTLTEAEETLSKMVAPSVNLANRTEFVEGKYMTETGATGNNASMFYTNKVPVSEGDVIYVDPSPRYVTAFNGDTVITVTRSNPFTVPAGMDGLIITSYMSSIDKCMISKMRLPYIPYGNHIANDYLQVDNLNALNGNNGITLSIDAANADTTIELEKYPKIIATKDRITGYCKFSTLGTIYFGYGYENNYYCAVDSTNIYTYSGSNLINTVPHGIAISDYLSFAIIMDDNRIGNITINSTGGKAETTIGMGYAKNGRPFIRSSTPLTNVILSAVSADIRKSIWWFGDSYSSKAPERIIGQLSNFGMINNMLIDAVPGYRSYYDADTGGYVELLKLLALSKPKYIVWALGMNDSEANYKAYLLRVKNICDVYGIKLYAVKIPSVPGIDNTGKAAYIDELGIKAIDWTSAVNATSGGVWYSGFLSSDNVHPTVKGAQAMAMRTLVDCPAIMQFD